MDLSGLNPPQREAVIHGEGALLVLAGAGSGKTRVVTHRIAHLCGRGVPAARIAALTFTNKAAGEMRERVAALLRDRARAAALTMGTFHSLGLAILGEEREALGLGRGFVVYDTADQLGCVRELLRNLSAGGRRFDARAILTRISLAKNAFVRPEDYRPKDGDEYDEITAEIYPRYRQALRAFAALDFDDLITETVALLRESPEVGARWRARFDHVLVDEYQDTNRAQLLLVKELGAERGNVCAVGDDDQSIYGWRGAEPENILRFERDFPGARIVVLDQNYRSTPPILGAANRVIEQNRDRRGKELWSARPGGRPPASVVAGEPEAEARFVAREISRLRDEERRRWDAFAVLYRSNTQTRELEEALRHAGIPFAVFGGQQFYERKEVKDVLAYLRLALNPRDEIAFRRVVNYPARGIGAATLERLVSRAEEEGGSLFDAARNPGEVGPRAERALAGFVALVQRLRGGLEERAAGALRALVDEIDLYGDVRQASPSGAAAQRRIDNVESLIRSIDRFQDQHPGRRALIDYVRKLSLASSEDDADPDGGEGKVTLTTLHGAKGLEFPVVFLVGCEEELLPHARTLMPKVTDVGPEHAADISEERRLFYVGLTRAMERLYLTRAAARRLRGRAVPRAPSRFLLEIPQDQLEQRDLAAEEERPVETGELSSFFSSLADS